MNRSVWKGSFVDPNLRRKIKRKKDVLKTKSAFEFVNFSELTQQQKASNKISTRSRSSVITEDCIGLIVRVHRGNDYRDVYVTEDKVGHKYGEFAYTRARTEYKSKRNKKK